MSQVLSIFKRGHTAQKHENHIQTYIIPIVCPQKATCNVWEFPQHLPPFQAKFHSDTPFFQVFNFFGVPQLQMEPVRNKTLLSTHMCYSCIPCRQWHSRLYSTLHPAAQIHVNSCRIISCSVQKSLITPHTDNTRLKHTNERSSTWQNIKANHWT